MCARLDELAAVAACSRTSRRARARQTDVKRPQSGGERARNRVATRPRGSRRRRSIAEGRFFLACAHRRNSEIKRLRNDAFYQRRQARARGFLRAKNLAPRRLQAAAIFAANERDDSSETIRAGDSQLEADEMRTFGLLQTCRMRRSRRPLAFATALVFLLQLDVSAENNDSRQRQQSRFQLIAAFFTYSPPFLAQPQQYPAPPVPRGYQPPPDPPLAAGFYPSNTQQQQPQSWQPPPQQPQRSMIQWRPASRPSAANSPLAYRQQPPPAPPVLINTVIQIFTSEQAPGELFSETRTLTELHGNDRVEISKNTTLNTNHNRLRAIGGQLAAPRSSGARSLGNTVSRVVQKIWRAAFVKIFGVSFAGCRKMRVKILSNRRVPFYAAVALILRERAPMANKASNKKNDEV